MLLIYTGKDSQLVNLTKMSSVNNHSKKKSASFETLRSSVYSLKCAYTVVDLIALVSGELPQDTGAAFQEDQSAAQLIVDKAILIDNLKPVDLLTSTGKVANVHDVTDLKSMSEDIAFLIFNCVVDGSVVDYRVTTANSLSFQFYLKLPQYIYDVGTDTTSPVAKARIFQRLTLYLRHCLLYFKLMVLFNQPLQSNQQLQPLLLLLVGVLPLP